MPFRPKRSDTGNLEPGPGLSPLRKQMNGAPESHQDSEGHVKSSVVVNLESQVNGKH